MSDDAVSDNTPISQRAPFGEGARVRVVRCEGHGLGCGFIGEEGTVKRSLDDWYGASGDQPHVMVLLDGGHERRTGWYFAIGDLEEIL
jgi:hypothetical protein